MAHSPQVNIANEAILCTTNMVTSMAVQIRQLRLQNHFVLGSESAFLSAIDPKFFRNGYQKVDGNFPYTQVKIPVWVRRFLCDHNFISDFEQMWVFEQ